MRTRTKWILVLIAALFIVAAGAAIFYPDSALGKIGEGAFVAAIAIGAWAIKQVKATIGSIVGSVEGKGDVFATVKGEPTQIDVWANGIPNRVTLPEGMISTKVRAVKVTEGGRVTVEILP